jgi:hypothetical protein
MEQKVLHSFENDLDVVGVGRTGKVRVNIFGLVGKRVADIAKFLTDKFGSVLVTVVALVLGEGGLQGGATGQLVLEQILLVQEQDHGGLGEPLGNADLVEQLQRFVHSVSFAIFVEGQIEARQGYDKKYGGNILEAIHPLLSLGTLASYVNQTGLSAKL